MEKDDKKQMGDKNQNMFREATKELEKKDGKSKKLAEDLEKTLKDTDDKGNPKKKKEEPKKKEGIWICRQNIPVKYSSKHIYKGKW